MGVKTGCYLRSDEASRWDGTLDGMILTVIRDESLDGMIL